jgi:hypothetical protein
VKGGQKAGGSRGGKGNKKSWEELESEESCLWKREECTEMFIWRFKK